MESPNGIGVLSSLEAMPTLEEAQELIKNPEVQDLVKILLKAESANKNNKASGKEVDLNALREKAKRENFDLPATAEKSAKILGTLPAKAI